MTHWPILSVSRGLQNQCEKLGRILNGEQAKGHIHAAPLEGQDFRILGSPPTFVSRWVWVAERRQSQPTKLTAVTPITPRRNHRYLPDRE